MPGGRKQEDGVLVEKKKEKKEDGNPCDVLSLYYKPVLSPLKPLRGCSVTKVGWLVAANGCKSLQPYGNGGGLFFFKNTEILKRARFSVAYTRTRIQDCRSERLIRRNAYK